MGMRDFSDKFSAMMEILNTELKLIESFHKGLKIGFLNEYKDIVKEFYLKQIPEKDKNKIEKIKLKLVVIVEENTYISLPIFSHVSLEYGFQDIYVLILVQDKASVRFSSFCTSCGVIPKFSSHMKYSEIYLMSNSELIYETSMTWQGKVSVRDKIFIEMKDNSKINYITKANIFANRFYESVYVKVNSNSNINLKSVILNKEGITILKENIKISGNNNKGELNIRLSGEKGYIANYSNIIALGRNNNFYTFCEEIPLSDKIKMKTIPALISCSKSNELYHEASIGELKEEEISYLISKGFSEEEAKRILLFS